MANKKISDLTLISAISDSVYFATDDGSQTYRASALQLFNYLRNKFLEAGQISNLTLTTAVGSSALTIAVKTSAGTTPTASDYSTVGFRNSTLTSGSFNTRSITAATTLVISSGSTLGQVSAQASRLFVYLIDNAGTPELAVSLTRFAENALVSTTAEGGAGAADSAAILYSTTARSTIPCRLIGYIDNTQSTAGTWASAGTQIQLVPYSSTRAPTKTRLTSGSGTYVVPLGCVALRVRLIGGGGAGGGATTSATSAAALGGGGGSGGYCERLYTEADIRSSGGKFAYAVGAGGTQGTVGNNPGGNGHDTTFGAGLLIMTGGLGTGGTGSPSVTAVGVTGTPGLGGVASGGDDNIPGRTGLIGVMAVVATVPLVRIGFGGPGLEGFSTALDQDNSAVADWIHNTSTSDAAPNIKSNMGAGGYGAYNIGQTGTARAGCAGSSGVIIIEEFY